MKRILVPIDFSETSSNALEIAAQIAKRQQAEIVVLHMLGLSEAVLTKNEIQEYEEARYYMELAKKRFIPFLDKPYLKNIKIREIVQNYKIFKEFNTLAQEQKIDLIVMGSHGTSGISEVLVGSNTEKVVRTSNVPVLVVKMKNPDFKIEKVLFACDFSEDVILAFKNIQAFTNGFSAKLKLIYINTPYNGFKSTNEIEEKIAKFFFKSNSVSQEVVIYDDYTVEQGLLNYSKKGNFDLLAIPTHGRKPFLHFLLGSRSIGEDVANHANLPVLTIKI
ncbi:MULTISPECIES: universal stress protein [Maribacter]|uniref:Universal stress protein n=1 Tax=Maribacter flavus TaxID=1658664 RepID=A0ABU7IGZ9_9FLAO|nr:MULTISPECIES: universal stress protein [Maribacter]MDC6405295.1 universal stress protein [Maribacter sp. PR66]MEE1971896.1 universal stress protein [Maribacter flavus]